MASLNEIVCQSCMRLLDERSASALNYAKLANALAESAGGAISTHWRTPSLKQKSDSKQRGRRFSVTDKHTPGIPYRAVALTYSRPNRPAPSGCGCSMR